MSDQTSPTIQPPAPRDASTAIWSLILGILSFACAGIFTAIPAVICGHRARREIKQSGGVLGGRGLATAGLALGYTAIALSVVVAAGIAGVAIWAYRAEAQDRADLAAGRGKEVISHGHRTSLRLPRDWTELKDLNERAELQVGNRPREQYVIVLSENKIDYAEMNLRKHHELTRNSMMRNLASPTAEDPVEITIDGRSALQDEIAGTEEGANVIFLHTTIDGNESFHQILAWTVKSRWKENKPLLQAVTQTFHEEK